MHTQKTSKTKQSAQETKKCNLVAPNSKKSIFKMWHFIQYFWTTFLQIVVFAVFFGEK